MNGYLKEVTALRTAALAKPDFGVGHQTGRRLGGADGNDNSPQQKKERSEQQQMGDEDEEGQYRGVVGVVGGGGGADEDESSPVAPLDPSTYFADPLKERDRPVVFDTTLGLAVETCVGEYDCAKLWDALSI